MATTTSITTTYAGEFAGKYIGPALLSGATLANQYVTIRPNIAFQEVVKKVSMNDIVKDATCDFDPTSTVTASERILTPKRLQVNLQLCKEDFYNDWEALQMGVSAWKVMPKNFTEFFLMRMAEKSAAWVEDKIWTGIEASAGQFGGFLPAFTADSDVIDVADATGITSANVNAELGKGYDAIPREVFSNTGDLTIYVSKNVFQSYQVSLAGFGTSGLGANGLDNKGLTHSPATTYLGLDMVLVPGLPDNTYVIAQKSNLWFGTGLKEDFNKVQIIDMEEIDGSQNVRYVMRFSAGTQYGFGTEVVFYDGRA